MGDTLIHSSSKEQHAQHLKQVFDQLSEANLIHRGCKCRIAFLSASYLGHAFSSKRMSPDPQKLAAVKDWAAHASVEEVRKFIGLSSFYTGHRQASP